MSAHPEQDREAPPPPWARVHVWQVQWVRDLVLVAAVLGVLYLGYVLSPVTVPMLIALLLAYLFEPLIARVTRSRWINRPIAAAAIIVIGLAAVVAPLTLGVGFAVVQGAELAQDIAVSAGKLRASVESPHDTALRDGVPPGAWRWMRDKSVELMRDESAEGEVRSLVGTGVEWAAANASAIAESIGKRLVGSGAEAVGAALGVLGSILYLVFSLFLVAFFFFFFSTGFGRIVRFWESLIPRRESARVVDLVRRMDRVIAAFVRGRLTIAAALAVVYTAGYWVIGAPAPLILGPLVGLLSLAPFAPLLGVPLTMALMALAAGSAGGDAGATGAGVSWWWIVLGPIAVYAVAQALDDYILTPNIQGKATNLDTPSILFATLAGGVLAGFYGVLVAIPVAACLKILLNEVLWPRVRAWAEGRAADPLPLSPEPSAGRSVREPGA